MPSWLDKFKEQMNKPVIPSPWNQEALEFFKQDLPYQDPVKRGVATPDMMAEQGTRDEMMQNAEFRPANARESKIAQMIRALRETEDKKEAGRLRKEIRKQVSKEELTPQMSYGKNYKDIIDSVFGKGSFDEKITPEIDKDMAGKGYDVSKFRNGNTPEKKMWNEHNTDRIRYAWDEFNDLITKTEKDRPEFLYHETSNKNIPSIGKQGLTTGNVPANISSISEPLQGDKIFFAQKPLGWVVDKEQRAILRTKPTEDMGPDINGKLSWQTRNPVPPSALEIESTPGVWEPLIEYMKKRGGK
jgi:hypothetical protein